VRARYAGRRLWAVLEPRSNTLRRKVFQHELAESLAIADQIVLADVFRSEAIPEPERLDPAAVVADLNASGKQGRLLGSADVIVDTIAPELRLGDVVAILSNGGFGGIYEKLPAKLRSIHEVKTTA
jgi:UDP-N-acetylmuramate: L-alanyl-gamma-D-glutamyl-meso-diaminopimelate ligase